MQEEKMSRLGNFLNQLGALAKKWGLVKAEQSSLLVLPTLGRIQVHAYPCYVCRQALMDGDLVVTCGTRLGHASCMVAVGRRDGTLLSGDLDSAPLFLYEDQWEAWLEAPGDCPVEFRWLPLERSEPRKQPSDS